MSRSSSRPFPTRRSLLATMSAGLAAAALSGASSAAAAPVEVMIGKDGWLFPAFDQVARVDLARTRQGAALVNDAAAVLKQAGIRVVLSLTPAKSRIYRDFLPSDMRFSPDGERRYAVALQELRRPGTPVPDLSEVLGTLRKAEPGSVLFFKADTHWMPRGASAAAIAVAEAVKGSLTLPASARPGTRLGPPTEMLRGENDLANLLPPGDRTKYPLQSYQLPRAEEDPAAGLLAEDGADTVLIGNSYMHPAFGFAATLSNRLDRPVWLVWKTHQFSPYWNLLDYLGSSAFKQQRPKLIVWNFHETDLAFPPQSAVIWGRSAMPPKVILSELRRRVAA